MSNDIRADIVFQPGFGTYEHFVLDVFQPLGQPPGKLFAGNDFLAFRRAEFQTLFNHYLAAFGVAHADFADHRRPFAGPFPELVDARFVAVVNFDPDFFAERRQTFQQSLDFFNICHDLFPVGFVFDYRHQNNLIRRDPRRNRHSFVVGVGHDEAADQTGGNAP